MLTIIRDRDSGKAKQLLEAARKLNCVILTQNKYAFRTKAHDYGFDDIEIIDYQDLEFDRYSLNKSILIHNGDKMLYWLMKTKYGVETLGFTATQEQNNV